MDINIPDVYKRQYLTNPSDCLYMRQEKGIRQTAWGIYQAVMETLEKY